MSLATLEWIRKDHDAMVAGHSNCMGCGAEIPVEHLFGHRPNVRWTCGTKRCNYRMIATHIAGFEVIEGGRDVG